MGGIHIAEALEIPYFRAFTMTWTRTRAYPHAFGVPDRKVCAFKFCSRTIVLSGIFHAPDGRELQLSRKYFIRSYIIRLVEAYAVAVVCALRPGLLEGDRRSGQQMAAFCFGAPKHKLRQDGPQQGSVLVQFQFHTRPHTFGLAGVDPCDRSAIVSSDQSRSNPSVVLGYWFLDDADVSAKKWTPPPELLKFIETAQAANKKIVYIGFGSIVVSDPKAMTRCVIDAIVQSGVYAILSKGWSDRLQVKNAGEVAEPEVPLPKEIFPILSVPHDWLFKRVDAACHHGGAGTTGASVRGKSFSSGCDLRSYSTVQLVYPQSSSPSSAISIFGQIGWKLWELDRLFGN